VRGSAQVGQSGELCRPGRPAQGELPGGAHADHELAAEDGEACADEDPAAPREQRARLPAAAEVFVYILPFTNVSKTRTTA